MEDTVAALKADSEEAMVDTAEVLKEAMEVSEED